MKRLLFCACLLLCSFCNPSVNNNAKEHVPASRELADRVFQITGHERMTDSDFIGLSAYLDTAWEGKGSVVVLVGDADSIVFFRSIGPANVTTGERINDQSLCELASVSKQFTAEAMMILKSKGLLSYDDTLRKFFPELKYNAVTIRHLLTHTSGVPDYEDLLPYWDTSKIAFNKDVIALLADKNPPAFFKAGAQFQYSNTGYVLLASIVEKISGKKFNDFLTGEIFRPVGMVRSRIYNTRRSGEVIPNYCYGYIWDSGSNSYKLPDELPEYRFVYSADGIIGDGCVNSTAKEMFLWDRALHDHKILPAIEQDSAYIPARLNDGSLAEMNPQTNYGFGWMIEHNTASGLKIWHGGMWPGYMTINARMIDKDRTVICFITAEPPSK